MLQQPGVIRAGPIATPVAPKLGAQRATTMNRPPMPQAPLSTGTSKLEPGQAMMMRQKVAARIGV